MFKLNYAMLFQNNLHCEIFTALHASNKGKSRDGSRRDSAHMPLPDTTAVDGFSDIGGTHVHRRRGKLSYYINASKKCIFEHLKSRTHIFIFASDFLLFALSWYHYLLIKC